MRENIGLMGEKFVWFEFMAKVKKNKTTPWDVLRPHIKRYINKNKA